MSKKEWNLGHSTLVQREVEKKASKFSSLLEDSEPAVTKPKKSSSSVKLSFNTSKELHTRLKQFRSKQIDEEGNLPTLSDLINQALDAYLD